MVTHNGLLRSFEGADGMKTGFTCDRALTWSPRPAVTGAASSPSCSAITRSGERNVRAASLLEHGFQQTGWKQLFNSTTLDNMPMATVSTP